MSNKLSEDKLLEDITTALIDNKAIGWMQGRMEFGPRALGGRSIIADPRSPKIQKQLNLKVKFRESFRPFAPSILEEKTKEWFEYEDHVEVLHTEADPLEVAELDLLKCDTEWRPGREVDQAAGGRLQEDGLPVRNTLRVQM